MASKLFFRIDDLGWHHDKFLRVARLFQKHGQKLNAEAIPLACLENNRLMDLREFAGTLEIHCHGFSHLDHQNAGKKAEFGSQRSKKDVLRDLNRGQEILRELFGDLYQPVFTPPWNRLDESFFEVLHEAGFKAVSIDGDKASPSLKIPTVNVNIDLHTRKDQSRLPTDEIQKMIDAQDGTAGIMLHHKPMTEVDFLALEELLSEFNRRGVKAQFMTEVLS